MYHHLQFTVVYSTCSLRNIFYFLAFVLCLDCLDKTMALVRSFLSLTQSCALTLAPAEAKPWKSVAVIWQSFVVILIMYARVPFPVSEVPSSPAFFHRFVCFAGALICNPFIANGILKELWYIVGLLLDAGKNNFSKSFSRWYLSCFGNKQYLIYSTTGSKTKRKPQVFCNAVGSSWDQ